MPDGEPWPKISIVTPSFRQGQFLEETIRSVLLQGYPNIEYIIMDGGSTDESVEVIKRYRIWLAYWVSEKDGGQADAIQRGIDKCTGSIFNWINSDDYLAPGILGEIGFAARNSDLIAGPVVNFSNGGSSEEIIPNRNISFRNLLIWEGDVSYHQPGCWLKTHLINSSGGLRVDLHYVFDYEMMLRILNGDVVIAYLDRNVAYFRLHEGSKTVSESKRFRGEMIGVWESWARESYNSGLADKIRSLIHTTQMMHYWYEDIEQISSSNGSRASKLLRLTRSMLKDPSRRINRFAFGAMRNIVRPKRHVKN